MVKVPSDPAQIIVNHASFRVQLGASARRAHSPRIARHPSAAEDTARIPVVTTVGTPGQTARRRPVVWTGRSAPDDTGAHRLLQAVRHEGVRHADERPGDAWATQVMPHPGTGYDPDDGPDTQPIPTPFVGVVSGAGVRHDLGCPGVAGPLVGVPDAFVPYGLEQPVGAGVVGGGPAAPHDGPAAPRGADGRHPGGVLGGDQVPCDPRGLGASRRRAQLHAEARMIDDDLRRIARHLHHAQRGSVVESRRAVPRGCAGCSGVHTHLTE